MKGYGDIGSDYSTCSFYNSFKPNIQYPSINDQSNGVLQIIQNNGITTLVVDLPANSQNVSFKFSISDYYDSSISTDFTLYLLCEKFDDTSLVVKALNQVPVQSGFNLYYFYISIRSLKYSLDTLELVANINGVSFKSTTISKEVYLIEFTTIDLELLIDASFNVSVVFPNKKYIVQTKPIYKSSPYQVISSSVTPFEISTFTQYGYGFSPVLLVYTNLVNDLPYISWSFTSNSLNSDANGLLKMIGSKNSTANTFILALSSNKVKNSFKYQVTYNQGSTSNSLVYSISTFNEFISSLLPLGTFELNDSKGLLVLEFLGTNYQVNNSPFSINFNSFNAKVEFPYGYSSGTNSEFIYRASFPKKTSNSNSNSNLDKFKIMKYPNGISQNYTNPVTPVFIDNDPPTITLFELKYVYGFKYLLRVQVADSQNEFFKFEYIKNGRVESLGFTGMVKTDLFEYMVDINSLFSGGLKVIDKYLNELYLSKGSFICYDPNGTPVYFNIPVKDIDLDIQDVILLKNDIDILDKASYNRIYFNSSTIPHDYPLEFSLVDPVSLDDFIDGRYESLPIVWSEQIKLFYCDFTVPMNTGPKIIQYKISTPYREIKSEALVPLRVSSTNFDNDGPLIEKIENANSFGKVGWRLLITDQVNGFSNGYIKAIGSVDSSSFKFNFTLANVTSPGGTKFIGQYDIIINVAENCVAQDYVIEYIYLEDSNKRYSQYSRFDANYNAVKDPLRLLLGSLSINSLLTTTTISCTTQDPTPPELLTVVSVPTIDTGSANRYFIFSITARDNESGLMASQTPIVYLTSPNDIFRCETNQKISSNTVTYSGECLLPLGFGYPSNAIYFSIYGLINNGGYYSGVSSDSPFIASNYIIDTTYSSTSLLLNYEPVYYHSKSDIVIYGRLVGDTTLVIIKYSNGENTRTYTNIKTIGQSAIVIPKDEIDIVGPFDVTAFNSSKSTNTLRVYPIYFENLKFDPSNPSPTPSSTPSSTPIPTNKPQKCIGTPECGGSNHGYCVENQGCVCYSPWIGNDCLSQIIIVPQPTINDTVPTIEIPIIDNHNNSNNNQTSTIFYKSLISIVSLREISIDGKPIKDKSFNFERWILDQVDSTTNQYYANITTKDKVINVIATLKWFENSTNIQFAGQNLTMNPSSIKYTIEINNFPFENNLSTLELVMQASFLSNSTSDSCSSKEFGDTSSGDNSNYLKIQIENRSLYGRFIKRCIIDDSDILSIDNKLLDEGMNTISSPNQVQTYIGISIPNFKSKVILDPDFSVIINPSSASSKSSNSVCTNKSSKLSSTKIAGIIIGCVVFACAIVVAISYSVYRTKKNSRYMKKVDVKLRNFNNTTNTN